MKEILVILACASGAIVGIAKILQSCSRRRTEQAMAIAETFEEVMKLHERLEDVSKKLKAKFTEARKKTLRKKINKEEYERVVALVDVWYVKKEIIEFGFKFVEHKDSLGNRRVLHLLKDLKGDCQESIAIGKQLLSSRPIGGMFLPTDKSFDPERA